MFVTHPSFDHEQRRTVVGHEYSLFVTLLILLLFPSVVLAHFGLVLPSDDVVSQGEERTIELELKFLHPMEQKMMDMARPVRFGVMTRGKVQALDSTLQEHKTPEGYRYWSAAYAIRRPGDHLFFMEPAPYWEPAEDKFIVHLTKVCVNAFGMEMGWDQPVGLEIEIVPLTRPYGLWTGNSFTGQVLYKGKPLPHAEIEVEYLNKVVDGRLEVEPPDEVFVTQVIKADENGIFTYSMPREGWWGFAALVEADRKIVRDGEKKPLELGAVYWVRCQDMR